MNCNLKIKNTFMLVATDNQIQQNFFCQYG